MGMVTHVLINNDCFSDILADPQAFVDSIRDGMNTGGVTRLDAGNRLGVGWCAMAHHSSYSIAYQNDHTKLVQVRP